MVPAGLGPKASFRARCSETSVSSCRTRGPGPLGRGEHHEREVYGQYLCPERILWVGLNVSGTVSGTRAFALDSNLGRGRAWLEAGGRGRGGADSGTTRGLIGPLGFSTVQGSK